MLVPRLADDQAPSLAEPSPRPLGGFGWPIALACLFNVACFPFIRANESSYGVWVWVAITLGVLAGELGAAAAWLVFGPGPLLRRLPIHWAVALGWYVAWAIGFAAAFSDQGRSSDIPEIYGLVLFSLPAVSLAVQLPMWPLRTHLGWRLETPRRAGSQPEASLSILDMILATVASSVSLAALRLTPLVFDEVPAGEYWTVWAIAVLCVAGISALALVPAMGLAFRVPDSASAIGVLSGLAGIAWLVTLAVISAIAGRGNGPPAEAVMAIAICYASCAGTLAVPMLIAKGRGYALSFARERGAASRAGTKP